MQVERKSGYLPSLDGWRGLAILGVMVAHDARGRIWGHGTGYYQGLGGYGVELFFAISGILISWRILENEQKTGRFDLKAFYIRRFYRIQPAQWVYLTVLALLMAAHILQASWKYWWGALLLYENFLWHDFNMARIVPLSYLVGHFWTLAVEEHFYLLISLFFFVVRRRRLEWLGALLLLLLLGQKILRNHGMFSPDVSIRRTYWMIQYPMLAAWTAMLLRRPGVMRFATRWARPWAVFSLTLVAVCAHHLWLYGLFHFTLYWVVSMDSAALSYCFSAWVVATMLHPMSFTTRLLEWAPLRFLGRISYSVYLWHLLFFGGGNPLWFHWHLLNVANQYRGLRYGLAIVVAILSYYFVEKPMIRLGHRLAPPATAGHRDLGPSLADENKEKLADAGRAV